MRLACLAVPFLDLQAHLRATPELRAERFALTDGEGLASQVLAATAPALAEGVRPGMTAAQARALAPSLRCGPPRPGQSAAARAALVDAGLSFAPAVEEDGDMVFLRVDDLGRLYATEGEVGRALLARLRALGLDGRVGVASSRAVARLAARAEGLDDDLRLVAEGAEARFLAPLRLSLLAPSPEAAAALHRFGARTLGDLARLPPRALAVRLGDEGRRLGELARGVAVEPFVPRPPGESVEEGIDLEFAVGDLEALGFVLRGLLSRLADRLAARQMACVALDLRLALEDHGVDAREIALGAPSREAATLLDLARLSLAARPPSAAVVRVQALARASRVPAAQLDLFRPTGPSPERLAATVARLAALVGEDGGQVGAPAPVDTHRDEAIAVGEHRPSSLPVTGAPPPRLALRRLRPPPVVEVIVDRRGTPRAFSGGGVEARLTAVAGPYRTSGEWWGEGFDRDHFEAQASDGALYLLRRDADGRWRLDGYYD